MYRCQITNRLSRPGDKQFKIVVEKRDQTYTCWDRHQEENFTTQGWEISKELIASEAGVEMWHSWSKLQREEFLENLKGKHGRK